MEKPLDYPT